jgi:DNA repair exonuclease SbcCD ATPase subunit
VRAAIAASSRAEASLSALHRAIQHVTANVSGAREANTQLNHELAHVREMLGSSNEERLALLNRVELLERELADAREQGEQERRFLIDDQDRFLAGLLEEHEQALARVVHDREALRAQLEQLARRDAAEERRSTATPVQRPVAEAGHELAEARRLIEKLGNERERSREVLRRLQAQRDDAQAQLARLLRENAELAEELTHLRGTTRGGATDGKRTMPARPNVHALGDEEVDAGDRPTVEASATQRTTEPPAMSQLEAAIIPSRRSPPAGNQRITAPAGPRVAEREPVSPLARKPDPISRPHGGYSVSGEEVSEEHASHPSSKPPRR